MLVSDYSYDLPEERIAKFPPAKRGSTRLVVLNRRTGAYQDSYYRNLADFLNPGDVLILNDTRVMQSRLFCSLPDGRERELVVLEKHGDEPQKVMYRGKLHDGDTLTVKNHSPEVINHNPETEKHSFASKIYNSELTGENIKKNEYNSAQKEHDSDFIKHNPDSAKHDLASENHHSPISKDNLTIKIVEILGNGLAEVESATPLAELAEKYGSVPLPPYLHRDATEGDKKRYQTVWAKHTGSAAAPTASLNMTDELLEKLQQKGIIIKYLTLHVGLGTFLPIRSDKIEGHQMHSEWFHIPAATIAAIQDAKAQNHRVVALGTTVARTLEFYAKTGKTEGEDDIFIYPGFHFELIDALLTNFHAPKSTVLMLAAAFAGWENLYRTYNHCIAEKYNFLSYGDSMLIC